jgi:hypothetical protein
MSLRTVLAGRAEANNELAHSSDDYTSITIGPSTSLRICAGVAYGQIVPSIAQPPISQVQRLSIQQQLGHRDPMSRMSRRQSSWNLQA